MDIPKDVQERIASERHRDGRSYRDIAARLNDAGIDHPDGDWTALRVRDALPREARGG